MIYRRLIKAFSSCCLAFAAIFPAGAIADTGAGSAAILDLGLAPLFRPDYPGSSSEQATLYPLVHLRLPLSQSLLLELQTESITVTSNAGLYASASYEECRGDSKTVVFSCYGSNKLTGIHTIDEAVDLGAGLERPLLDHLSADLSGHLTPRSGSQGGTSTAIDLSASYELGDESGLKISAEMGTRYADSRYLNTWFGVSADDAARSRFSEYTPGGGFPYLYQALAASVPLGSNLFLRSNLELSELVGPARASPLTGAGTQLSLVIGVVYRFSLN